MREIYRSDVGLSQAGSGNGCRRFQYPSAAMSFPPVIPGQVALRQSRLRFTDWTILAPHPPKQNPAVYTKELTHPMAAVSRCAHTFCAGIFFPHGDCLAVFLRRQLKHDAIAVSAARE